MQMSLHSAYTSSSEVMMLLIESFKGKNIDQNSKYM